VFIQFKIDAPIFVARQLQKHQVGLAWNEISRRYVDSEPEMYQVYEWRRRSANKKQGSMSEPIPSQEIANTIKKELDDKAVDVYNRLLKLKVCPEQARMVLPQDMMTSWYWSGSLYAFSRVCNLRLKEDAQYETRQVAQIISDHCAVEFPVSWKYLCQAGVNNHAAMLDALRAVSAWVADLGPYAEPGHEPATVFKNVDAILAKEVSMSGW
jgi:thymidylate synthase (FAD)